MSDKSRSDEQMRERVLTCLYGGMSPAEEEAFRSELPGNAALARLLAEEEAMHRALPVGGEAHLPDGAVEESRLLLRAALRREGRRRPSPTEGRGRWPVRWLDRLVPRFAWVAGALALFACGLSVGRTIAVQGDPPAIQDPVAAAAVIGEVVDIRVRSFDATTGRVQLELSALTTSPMEGYVGDPAIQSVLATALQDGDLEPGPRLQAVGLLRHQAATGEVSRALTQALLQDDNPGVRLAAAEALSGQAGDERVRRALQECLLHDANPGVRVAAIEALRDLHDGDTRQAFERSALSETNEYIRAEAHRALASWPISAPVHL